MSEHSLSHYRIIHQLGAGGMGEVYLAEDTALGRRIALKVLPPEHTQDEDRLRRFRQEARLASALNHPNILTIYEVGEDGGRHFIAAELVQGDTLRTLLRRSGPMAAGQALNVAVQAASALAAAHTAGIVHRDIKPENIMVRDDGYVKVLDFGLAKLTEAAAPPVDPNSPTVTVSQHTQPGVVLGTAHYMSPEQAAGRAADARSDIFSLGAVLYEMVSGQRAFQAASIVEVLAAIIHREPGPLPAAVPSAVTSIITRCLRKDPARRYQTMADLKVALEDVREELSAPVRQDRVGAPRLAWALWLLAIAAAGAAGFLAWQSWRAPQDQPSFRATSLTTLPGVEQAPSLSPDGNYAVFAWTGPKQDNQDIYVQMIGSGSPLPLTNDPLNDYNPVWSPDGRWIAFFRSQPPAPTGVRNRELRLKPPLGGAERKLADIRSHDFPYAVYLAWSADSTSLVVTDSTGDGKPDALFVVSLETGEKTQLTKPQAPVMADTSPAVSPDGRSVAFLRRMSWGAGELQVVPLGQALTAAGEPRRLTPLELRADHPAWLPSGREIVFAAKGNLWRQDVSAGSPPTRLPFVGEDGLMPAISRPRSGPARLVYVRSFIDQNFWRIDIPAPGAPATSAPVMAIASTKREYHPEFSPDGRRVAFTSTRSGEPEIWLSDPDGSSAVQLTSIGAQETMCAHWSPDGQTIAFSSNPAGEFDIYVISAAGGRPSRLTSHPAIDICPTFSRDGKWLYFPSMRSGDYRTWKMPVSGGEAVQITTDLAGRAMEAPNGDRIYYLSPSIVSPVWRLSTSGGDPVKIIDSVVWFNFSLAETGAYYIDRIDGETRLQFLNLATSERSTVARNLGEVGAWLTPSPDGRSILYSRVDSFGDDLMLVENFR